MVPVIWVPDGLSQFVLSVKVVLGIYGLPILAVVGGVALLWFGIHLYSHRDEYRHYHARRLFWWQRRRPVAEFDTRIYIGRPGAGKTLFCVRDGILLLRQGCGYALTSSCVTLCLVVKLSPFVRG